MRLVISFLMLYFGSVGPTDDIVWKIILIYLILQDLYPGVYCVVEHCSSAD
jgi:hypothetical protein